MKLENKITGDVLEIPRPGVNGRGVILLNGEVIARLLYSGEFDPYLVTFNSGEQFDSPEKFSAYVIEILRKRIPHMGHEQNFGQACGGGE